MKNEMILTMSTEVRSHYVCALRLCQFDLEKTGIDVTSVMCHKSVSMSCACNQAILALEQLPQGPGGTCQGTCGQGPGGSGA